MLEETVLEDLTSIRKDITKARYLLYDSQSSIIEVIAMLGIAINKVDNIMKTDDKSDNP